MDTADQFLAASAVDQFLAELREVAPQFKWFLDGGAIRGDRDDSYEVSRGIWAIDVARCCPITAVRLAKTGDYIPLYRPWEARPEGMSEADGNRIARTADGNGSDPKLRQRLLDAVGL